VIIEAFLSFLRINIGSIKNLNLSDQKQLLKIWSEIKDMETIKGVKYFGRGESLRPVSSVDQLVAEFQKQKAESYSFSDVKRPAEPDMARLWSIGIRRSLLILNMKGSFPAERIRAIIDELLALHRILLGAVSDGVDIPFSSLRTPNLGFQLARPPRDFESLVEDSIADLIYLKGQTRPENQHIVDLLRSATLPESAERSDDGEFVLIVWGDVTKQPVSSILSTRYAWLAQTGEFGIKSGFNESGDKEFGLWNSKPTRDFTAYSSFDGRAAKAVAFDEPEEALETIEKLSNILKAGKTSSGETVVEITLVVPTRESALRLHDLAVRFHMRVVYVGEDKGLWDASPSEYEAS
jgi:hypothetical protein